LIARARSLNVDYADYMWKKLLVGLIGQSSDDEARDIME
jgi:hypothetical protein